MIKVIGIKITDRIKEAGLTQGILSGQASVITTRLGFHEVSDDVCSREAYIILHLKGDSADTADLKSDLSKLGGIKIREMNFSSEKEALNIESDNESVDIIGILTEKDQEAVMAVQKLLTSYGCNIRTRMGVNETFYGEPTGLIILELEGEKKQRILLEKNLKELKKVHVRTMVF